MSQELLLEIGAEELPAGVVTQALKDLPGLLEKFLSDQRLVVPLREIRVAGTPRRLVLSAMGVPAVQPGRDIEILGPALRVARVEGNKWSKAAIGFAQRNNVDVMELQVLSTSKGEVVGIRRHEKGRPALEVLAENLPGFVGAIPFKKSMRWSAFQQPFSRPVRWIAAVLGGETIPFEYAGVKSGNRSRGHRFMAPDEFPVSSFDDLTAQLRKAHVLLDPAERKQAIRSQLAEKAKSAGLVVVEDDDLLETVTQITEWPLAELGEFEEKFLEIPSEVLISTMRNHQKYFALRTPDLKLSNRFAAVNNTAVRDPAAVMRGHGRVIRARFSDAAFYFHEDRKKKLEDRVLELGHQVYHPKLGSYLDKTNRLVWLADQIMNHVGYAGDRETVRRAAYLCKADLLTGMVFEFPELQGYMGGQYARAAGETEAVARAIEEHYLPKGASDALPATDAGAIVSLADKFDTLCGAFGIGQKPTGSADPFALRRAALGMIRILRARKWPALLALVPAAAEQFARNIPGFAKPEELRRELAEFVETRLKNLFAEEAPADIIDAVLTVPFAHYQDLADKLAALAQFRESPGYARLSGAFKRAANIVDKARGEGLAIPESVDTALFREAEEGDLYAAVKAVQDKVAEYVRAGWYNDAFNAISSSLKDPVDRFFEKVMVMDQDPAVRANRLALLAQVRGLCRELADFSRVQGP
ncbi:MAG: Glycine--tRNA ligase beta subunit [Myxococcota bacterium]|nr:Glycine--tRNA ligase beta subunit [Myxococcota bacterium]